MSNAKFKRSNLELARVRAAQCEAHQRPEVVRHSGVMISVSRRLEEKRFFYPTGKINPKNGKPVLGVGKRLVRPVTCQVTTGSRSNGAMVSEVALVSSVGERPGYEWQRG